MPFEENEKNIIFTLIILGSILSIIGSGAIILNTILFNNFTGKNKIWNRIIFFLSLCDLCGSIDLLNGKNLIPEDAVYSGSCRFQGLRIQFFFIASALWTAAIAINIFLVVVMNKEIYEIERFEWIYHVFIWGISLSTSLFLFFKDQGRTDNKWIVGNATFWCWITENGSKYRLILFFGPLWTVFFINVLVFIIMKIVIKKRKIDTDQIYAKNSIASRYHLYLLVLFITWIWGTINRIQNEINSENPKFPLFVLHAFFTPLQGFLNSIVYFWCTVFKHFFALIKNIQKEQDDIKERRRRRDNQRKENGKHSSSNRDHFDNYYVYNPRPSPIHHHHSYRNKDNTRHFDSQKMKRHTSTKEKGIQEKTHSREHGLLNKKKQNKKINMKEKEVSENRYSNEYQQYEKKNDETLISISYSNSVTPMLNKNNNNEETK
ncbi:hypothetical protein BCR36DRAFT_406969 [Piromyces finnis]|uniref:G-protein coupled receptors family 2 profile 2 domain-containing protein n=1 Tax=Piromyces finnis TaxID=1754191 RepID=A0A1Y1UXB3_9FUNG|nr:hypothetical protein BCR36DRAFT_406969 [Piromyces finnis]|eukprot:ORX42865.1 hypothetical protein BCR36DRAFT_406969 [Piromyces finnis]